MIEVKARAGESVESLLKRFTKAYIRAGVLKEVKKRIYFTSPSLKRHKKEANRLHELKKLKRRESRKKLY